MLIVAIAVVAALFWGVGTWFGYRYMTRLTRAQREHQLDMRVATAAWSDSHAEALLNQHPRSEVLWRHYTSLAIRRADWPEAERRCLRYRQHCPRASAALLFHVRILLAQQQADAVTRLLRRAVRRFPFSLEIRLAHARDAVRRGDTAAALRRYAWVRWWFPNRSEGYSAPAMVLIAAGRRAAAEALVAKGLRRLPDSAELHSTRAELADRAGDHAGALAQWQAMRVEQRMHPHAWLLPAQVLARLGRADEAAALIEQGQRFFPNDPAVGAAARRLRPAGPPPAQNQASDRK